MVGGFVRTSWGFGFSRLRHELILVLVEAGGRFGVARRRVGVAATQGLLRDLSSHNLQPGYFFRTGNPRAFFDHHHDHRNQPGKPGPASRDRKPPSLPPVPAPSSHPSHTHYLLAHPPTTSLQSHPPSNNPPSHHPHPYAHTNPLLKTPLIPPTSRSSLTSSSSHTTHKNERLHRRPRCPPHPPHLLPRQTLNPS